VTTLSNTPGADIAATILSKKSEPVQVEIVDRTDFSSVAGQFGASFLTTWTVMLALGALHTDYLAVPAVGYWDTWLAFFVLGAVGWAVRGSRRSWTKPKRSRR